MREWDRTNGVVAIRRLCEDVVKMADKTLDKPFNSELDVFYDYIHMMFIPMIQQHQFSDFIMYKLRPKEEE